MILYIRRLSREYAEERLGTALSDEGRLLDVHRHHQRHTFLCELYIVVIGNGDFDAPRVICRLFQNR